MSKEVQSLYDKYPYPDIPLLAKPVRRHTAKISYQSGFFLKTGKVISANTSIKILIAGCGNFEPLVVAIANPNAEITAIDFSQNNLNRLKRRLIFSPFLKKRITPLQWDLHESLPSNLEKYDYIICTGVLHHTENPSIILKNLQHVLKKDGLIRLMIYAKHSRFWIYALKNYFKICKSLVDKSILKSCHKLLKTLPQDHPFNSVFRTYSDSKSTAGVIDGFFHPCDKPISSSELEKLLTPLSLKVIGFAHNEVSTPDTFFSDLKNASPELACKLKSLSIYEKLELLDSFLELSSNPVFWIAHMPISQDKPSTDSKPDSSLTSILSINEIKSYFKLLDTDAEYFPSILRWKILLPVRECILRFNLSSKDLENFQNILSIYVDKQNIPLPYLTIHDLFEDLTENFSLTWDQIRNIILSFPKPLNLNLLSEDEYKVYFEKSAIQWFVKIRRAPFLKVK